MERKRTVFAKPKLFAPRLYKREGAASSSSSERNEKGLEPLDLSMKFADNDIKKEVEELAAGQEGEKDGEIEVKKKKKKSFKKVLPNGKKTLGRVKIDMKLIPDKVRRQTTFAKRKAGLMKKTEEISILTGAECFLLVASETGKVFTYATPKLDFLPNVPGFKPLFQSFLAKEFQFAPPNSVFISTVKAEAMMKARAGKNVPSTSFDSPSTSAAIFQTDAPSISTEIPDFQIGAGPSSTTSGLLILADAILGLDQVKEEEVSDDSDQ